MQTHRVGRFKVNRLFLVPDNLCVKRLMAKVIIVDVKPQWNTDALEYLAYSDDFEEVGYGEIPPEYEVVCSQDPITVTFKRLPFNG